MNAFFCVYIFRHAFCFVFVRSALIITSQVIDIGSGGVSVFQSLYGFTHHSFVPLMRSFTHVGEGEGSSAGSGTSGGSSSSETTFTVCKKLNELEFALQACLQHTDIPDIHLAVHPLVAQAAARCSKEGRLLSLEELELEHVLQDSSFLNNIQVNCVVSVYNWTSIVSYNLLSSSLHFLCMVVLVAVRVE